MGTVEIENEKYLVMNTITEQELKTKTILSQTHQTFLQTIYHIFRIDDYRMDLKVFQEIEESNDTYCVT